MRSIFIIDRLCGRYNSTVVVVVAAVAGAADNSAAAAALHFWRWRCTSFLLLVLLLLRRSTKLSSSSSPGRARCSPWRLVETRRLASTFRELLSAVSAIMMHVAAMPATTSSADMFRKVSMTWLMFGGNGGFSSNAWTSDAARREGWMSYGCWFGGVVVVVVVGRGVGELVMFGRLYCCCGWYGSAPVFKLYSGDRSRFSFVVVLVLVVVRNQR